MSSGFFRRIYVVFAQVNAQMILCDAWQWCKSQLYVFGPVVFRELQVQLLKDLSLWSFEHSQFPFLLGRRLCTKDSKSLLRQAAQHGLALIASYWRLPCFATEVLNPFTK